MAARLLLLVILLICSVTISNWFKLGQFLTVSLPLAPDQQKNENVDNRLVENTENSRNSDGQSIKQEGNVTVREEKEEVKGVQEEMEEEDKGKEGKEEEKEEVNGEKEKEGKKEEEEEEEGKGLLDWLHKQQERRASLATACARDSGWELFHFFYRNIFK